MENVQTRIRLDMKNACLCMQCAHTTHHARHKQATSRRQTKHLVSQSSMVVIITGVQTCDSVLVEVVLKRKRFIQTFQYENNVK